MHSKYFNPKYIVGAYTTSPNLFTWDSITEKKYFNGLKSLDYLSGLELPFWGYGCHPFDDKWLLSNLDPSWENILTCIPGTTKFIEKNPSFGISSKNHEIRKKSIQFYKRAFNCVSELKDKFGSHCVKSISLASAPGPKKEFNKGNSKYFHESLCEISSWDWDSTKLSIEHCDALSLVNPNPQKGYLPLDEEINAIKIINNSYEKKIGVIINWGRSAIEGKNPEHVLKHLRLCRKEKLLSGIIFSGTTSSNDNLYGAWSDLHMPPCVFKDYQHFEKDSLMTYDEIKKSLYHSDYINLEIIGLKLHLLPQSASINDRIGLNKSMISILNEAIKSLELKKIN